MYFLLLISIHTLREEGDVVRVVLPPFDNPFLSTPSARRATAQWAGGAQGNEISIHTLREEGDCQPFCAMYFLLLISIHTLREEGDYSASFFMRS